mgnify:CR=1 FL=1
MVPRKLTTSLPWHITHCADWANPVAYFVRGLVVNEFESSDWAGPSPVPGSTLGEFYMTERWVVGLG